MKTISSSTKHNVSINIPVPWISMGFYSFFFSPVFFFFGGGGRKQLKHQWDVLVYQALSLHPCSTDETSPSSKGPRTKLCCFLVFKIPQPWYVYLFWKFGLWILIYLISNHIIYIFWVAGVELQLKAF